MNLDRDTFLSALRAGCRRVALATRRWLVAVSGGADSVALLRGLVELQTELQIELVVGHFDHRLRGEESAQDAEWVRQLAESLKLPHCIGASDAGAPRLPGAAFDEDTARKGRYEFLIRTALELKCSAVATAHTADDQAETVLHHLCRGTGIAGLKGIPWVREVGSQRSEVGGQRSEIGVQIVRPMLGVTRERVIAFLHAIGQGFRTDRTNADVTLTRNWLRHAILPQLRERWPHVTNSFCRLAEQSEELSAAMSQLANELLDAALIDKATQPGPAVIRVDVTILSDRPRHLVREMFVVLWRRQDWPLQEMSAEHWNRLADLVTNEGVYTLPGAIEARRRGKLIALTTV